MSAKWVTQSPTEKIVEQVNKLGLEKAAKHYCTSPSTLSRWLGKQNYKRKSIYVKAEKAS